MRPLARTVLLLALLCATVRGTAQDEYILSETDEGWEQVAAPDPETPEGELALARRTLAAGNARRAQHLASGWINRHPYHPLVPEAYVLRGDALVAQRHYYKALFDFEYVARGFPASEAFVTALERELDVARLFAAGTRRKLFGLRIIDASDEAEELLIRIQERMPGSQLAEEAAMELADFYFRKRRMLLAGEMYSIFLENHPDSPRVTDARRRLIYAYLARYKGPLFDASGIHEARARLGELIRLEPATAEEVGAEGILNWIDEQDARKLLLRARWYVARNDPIAAEFVIRGLLRRYPRTVAATAALELVDDLLPRLPRSVLEEAPDYDLLRQAILGTGGAAGEAEGSTP
ncbi:MAG: outer membrane protein assembly factor BamD [Planctomycetota bacterium]|jgi:outer membrane protein assembly factor BamD (BamD/ComL family)